MRFLRSYGIALVILVVIAFWMAGGVFIQGGKGPGEGEVPIISLFGEKTEHAEAEHAPGEPDPSKSIAERNEAAVEDGDTIRSVRIKTFTIQPMPLEVPLRGRTQAKAIISAIAETSGTVEQVHVAKGDSVSAGDLLCTLDKGTRQASVAQAEAALERAQLDFDTNAKLREKGLAAPNTASQLEVGLKSAQAALEQAKAELERTEIRAKVSGMVQAPLADTGALLNPGGVCATIVDLHPILFVGSVPEARIGLARTGLPVSIETITGQKAEGKVTYISATADPATRTFAVEVEVPNPDGLIRDGLTAQAKVNMGTMPAHLVPQSALTLADDGTLGVRAVKDSKVVFHAITIVSDTRDGVWVTGLPATLDIITLGQENVQAGQIVNADYAEEGAAS